MLDFAKIRINAGNGGRGQAGFRREKYVPKGGPDGGDGGKGGNVYLVASNDVATLLDFQFLDHFEAQSGEPGGTSNKRGSDGQDLYMKVPVGTIVKINKLLVDVPNKKQRKGDNPNPIEYKQKMFNYRKMEKTAKHQIAQESGSINEQPGNYAENNSEPNTVDQAQDSDTITDTYTTSSIQQLPLQANPQDHQEEIASGEYKVYSFSTPATGAARLNQTQNNEQEEDLSERPYFDLDIPGKTILIARGGKGGRGNTRFKSSTNKAPKYAEPGQRGESLEIEVILKMVANVGLIGMPNAGKSTILSKLTAASPKIGDYPFTTVEPNLGVMYDNNRSIILADIPGLIEGASYGKGLGHKFLQHVERTQVLLHVIALPDITPDATPNSITQEIMHTYETIRSELMQYGEILPIKQEIIIINKIDKFNPDTKKEYVTAIEKELKKTNRLYGFISAQQELGLNGLKKLIIQTLDQSKE